MDPETFTLIEETPIDDVAGTAARLGLPLVTLTHVPADLTLTEMVASVDEAHPLYRLSWSADDARSMELVVVSAPTAPNEAVGTRPLNASIPQRAWLREQGARDVVTVDLGDRGSASIAVSMLAEEEVLAVVNGVRVTQFGIAAERALSSPPTFCILVKIGGACVTNSYPWGKVHVDAIGASQVWSGGGWALGT